MITSNKIRSFTKAHPPSLLLIICLFISSAVLSAPFEHIAKYDVGNDYLTVGEAVIQLKKEKGRWTYSLDSYPTGVARAIVKQRLIETSTLIMKNDQLIPVDYHYTNNVDRHKDAFVIFDYKQNQLLIQKGAEEVKTYPLNQPIFDRLSVVLKIQELLSNGINTLEFDLIDKTKRKLMTFKTVGEEVVETPFGRFKAIKIKRYDRKRTTYSWHAKVLNYTPVMVEQYRLDKLEARLRLTAFEQKSTN